MSSATFIGTDTATGGLWSGVYGATGYSKQEPAAGTFAESLPSGVTSIVYTMAGGGTFGNAVDSGNNRDLQRVSDPSKYDDIVWYDGTQVKVTITVSDGATRAVAFYMRDSSAARSQGIAIKTAGGTPTLDAQRSVANLTNGVYYRYEFSGSIDVEIDKLGGANAVLQGIFFDAPAGGGSVVPVKTAQYRRRRAS